MQITEPPQLTVTASSTGVLCSGGSSGSLSSIANGGINPYNYSWMPGNMAGQNLSNLPFGTYTVTATDLNSCIATATVSISQPTPIVLVMNSINSNCSLANGQASVSASGGTGSFSYQWFPAGGTNATATGLLAGTYSVTVTDGNGCISTSSVTVNDNASPAASVISTTNVSCHGGTNATATASVSGGALPLSYLWSPAGGTNAIGTGLSIGTYTVLVTDKNGCTSIAISSPITEPLALTSVMTQTNVSCKGGNDGAASISVFGGTTAYGYLWVGGSTATSISNLTAGTYTVQVTDANNCKTYNSVQITEPPQLTIGIGIIKNVSCKGGNDASVSVNVGGGTPVYNYNWLPSGGNSQTATGLVMGTYTLMVSDIKNCVKSQTVTITEPVQALSATSIGSIVSCFGSTDGTGSVTPIGGTIPYSYQWNPIGGTAQTASNLSPQNYFVVITDKNGCNTNTTLTVQEPTPLAGSLVLANPTCGFNNGSITAQVSGATPPYSYSWSPVISSTNLITGLAVGTYNLQVKDSKNCSKVFSPATLVNITSPVINVVSTHSVSCFGGNDGNAVVSISQGTPAYIINWTPYGGNTSTASSLSNGTYTVNVTDANGCQSNKAITINQPVLLSVSLSAISPVMCYGDTSGSASVLPVGGISPYTYLWASISKTTSSVNNLKSGVYTVIVADKNNCTASLSTNVTQPSYPLSSTVTTTPPLCYGLNGTASIITSGGTIGYNYTWSSVPVQTGSTATIPQGTYTIITTDNNQCKFSNVFTITQPLPITTFANSTDTSCSGKPITLTASATGGVGNYYYQWQPVTNNTNTYTDSPVNNAVYTVMAFDNNKCPGTLKTISVSVFSLVQSDLTMVGQATICPNHSSAVLAEVASKVGPVTYSWSPDLGNGSGPYVVTPAINTTYSVTVTSTVCGNSVTDKVPVVISPAPKLIVSSDTNAFCLPGSLQFYDNSVVSNSNDPITSWSWSFGDGTTSSLQNPSHSYTASGTYGVNLTVSTEGGCTSNNSGAPYTVNANDRPVAAFSLASSSLELPLDQLIISNKSTGAISFDWSFGDGSTSMLYDPTYEYKTVGNYKVQLIAISQFGCKDTAFTNVTTDAAVIFPNAFSPNSSGPSGGYYNPKSYDNDIFFPYTSGVIDYRLEIFNRWGELIFVSTDINQGWDGYYRGNLCEQDVYIWKAFLRLNNGKTYNKTGDVTLLK